MDGPIFIPDEYYLPSCPEVVDTEGLTGRRKLDKKYKASGKGSGDQNQMIAFERLKQLFAERGSEKVIIIQSWMNKLSSSSSSNSGVMKNDEADYLLICPAYKTIINLEVKSAANKNNAAKAAKQLEDHFKTFMNILPMAANKGWTFTKTAFFPKIETKDCCAECSMFVLTKESDVYSWWRSCVGGELICGGEAERKDTNKGKRLRNEYEDFKDIINRLTYLMHVNFPDAPLTRRKASDKVTKDISKKVGSKKNILLWTKQQYKLLYEGRKQIILSSAHGTGKTVLLTEKCIEVAKMLQEAGDCEKKVYYIVYPPLSSTFRTLLTHEKKACLRMFRNLEVVDILDILEDLGESPLLEEAKPTRRMDLRRKIITFMRKKVAEDGVAGFFVDEFEPTYICLELECWEEFKHRGLYLWVALARPYQPLRQAKLKRLEDIGFCIIELTENLRNVKSICREAFGGEAATKRSSSLKPEGPSPIYIKPRLTYINNSKHDEEFRMRLEAALYSLPDCEDLLIVLPRFNLGTSYNLKRHLEITRRCCQERDLNVYHCLTSLRQVSSNMDTFFGTRRGVVIVDYMALPGIEFKSVIAFVPLAGAEGERREDWVISSRSVILRCVCNLVLVETSLESDNFFVDACTKDLSTAENDIVMVLNEAGLDELMVEQVALAILAIANICISTMNVIKPADDSVAATMKEVGRQVSLINAAALVAMEKTEEEDVFTAVFEAAMSMITLTVRILRDMMGVVRKGEATAALDKETLVMDAAEADLMLLVETEMEALEAASKKKQEYNCKP